MKNIITIETDNNSRDNAKILSVKIKNEEARKRTYALSMGAFVLTRYLKTQGFDASNKQSLFKIPAFSENLEIADIYLENARIDVRVTFDEKKFYIPKSHKKYSVHPDFYIILSANDSLTEMKILGYTTPSELDEQVSAGEYYEYETKLLKSLKGLKKALKCVLPKDETFSHNEHKKISELAVSFFDFEISESENIFFIKHLLGCRICRERISEFNEFDTIITQVKNYPELFDDSTLDVLTGLDCQEEKTSDFLESEISPSMFDLVKDISDTAAQTSALADALDAEAVESVQVPGSLSDLADFLDETVLDEASFGNEVSEAEEDIEKIDEHTEEQEQTIVDKESSLEGLSELVTSDESEKLEETFEEEVGLLEISEEKEVEIPELETPDEGEAEIENEFSAETPLDEENNESSLDELAAETIVDETFEIQNDDTLSLEPSDETELETINALEIEEDKTPAIEEISSLDENDTETDDAVEESIMVTDNLSDEISPQSDDFVMENSEPDELTEIQTQEEIEELHELDEVDESVNLSESAEESEVFELNSPDDILLEADDETLVLDADADDEMQTKTLPETAESALLSDGKPEIKIEETINEIELLPEPALEEEPEDSPEELSISDLEELDAVDETETDSPKADEPQEEAFEQPVSSPDYKSEEEEEEVQNAAFVEEEVQDFSADEPFIAEEADTVAADEEPDSEIEYSGIELIDEEELPPEPPVENPHASSEIEDLLDDELMDLLSEDSSTGESTPKVQEQETDDSIGALFESDEHTVDENGETTLDLSQEPVSAATAGLTKKIVTGAILLLLVAAGGVTALYLKFNKANETPLPDMNPPAQDNSPFDAAANQTASGPENETPMAQDINKSMTNVFSDQPAAITITKISWEVSQKLASDETFKNYLQIAGKNLQMNLQNDLAYTTDFNYNNKIKISFEVGKDNAIKRIQVTESSGSEQIDNVVLQSIKETLKYINVPNIKDHEGNYNLSIEINF